MLAENSSYHLSQSLLDKKSDAFPLERFRFLPDAAKFKNITTYLGEYRFNQAIDDYCLIFEGGLRGKHETELLATQIKRSIARKKELWKKTHREEADLSGVLSMEKQLTTSQEGDFIFEPTEEIKGPVALGRGEFKDDESAERSCRIIGRYCDNGYTNLQIKTIRYPSNTGNLINCSSFKDDELTPFRI